MPKSNNYRTQAKEYGLYIKKSLKKVAEKMLAYLENSLPL